MLILQMKQVPGLMLWAAENQLRSRLKRSMSSISDLHEMEKVRMMKDDEEDGSKGLINGIR